MDLELRESVDLAREVIITLAPDLIVTIEWGSESRSFRLGLGERAARARALGWFRDVVGLPSDDLREALWRNGIGVGARRPSAEWGPTIELIDAIGRAEESIESSLPPNAAEEAKISPAVFEAGREFLVRAITFDSAAHSLVIEPFHGYRILLDVEDARRDGDVLGFATTLGDCFARPAGSSDIELADLSRFGRLWDPRYREMFGPYGPPGEDVVPDIRVLPESAQVALFTRLMRIGLPDGLARNMAERDVESVEIFAGYGNHRIRAMRHVLHRPSVPVLSTVAGEDHDGIDDDSGPGLVAVRPSEPRRGVVGFWAPIGLRAAARVDWHPDMRTKDLLLLAADPQPTWSDLPSVVRERVISFLASGLDRGDHGSIDPEANAGDGDRYWDDDFPALTDPIGDELTWYDLAQLAGRLVRGGAVSESVDIIEVLRSMAAALWSMEPPIEPVLPVGYDEDPRMPDGWD